MAVARSAVLMWRGHSTSDGQNGLHWALHGIDVFIAPGSSMILQVTPSFGLATDLQVVLPGHLLRNRNEANQPCCRLLNQGPNTGGRLPSLTTCRQVSHKPILHSRNYAAMIYLSHNKDGISPLTSTTISQSHKVWISTRTDDPLSTNRGKIEPCTKRTKWPPSSAIRRPSTASWPRQYGPF